MTWYPRQILDGDETNSTLNSTTITAHASTNTKGTYTALLAALAFDIYMVDLFFQNSGTSTVDSSMLLDIGADAAGGTSYTVYVPNLLTGHTQSDHGIRYLIPVYIPAGATVAARCQSATGSQTVDLSIHIYGGRNVGGPQPGDHGHIVDYGTATAGSNGTTPANAAVDTEGAWVEMTAATTHPHHGLITGHQGSDGSMTAGHQIYDIGIGAATSEVAIIENIFVSTTTSELARSSSPSIRLFETPIPEGSRLAVRSQADGASEQQHIDVAVYGWG